MKNSVCEECKLNPWKYKCPGCSIRSCGLPCVKAHKQRTGCTGKKNLINVVPLSKFDDNLLLSDYIMLEETKRVAESALRTRNQLCKNHYSYKLPYLLRSLQNAAYSRRTKLLYLPSGMFKRGNNQSRYDNRSKCISWTIEWRFHSTDVILVDHGVGEDTNLCSVIRNHLKPGPWIHKLKPFCDVDLDSLKLFIRQYPKGAKAPFKELDIKAPLRQQLAKVAILEYPVIHVYLPSQSYDFEVINHVNTTPNPNDSLFDGYGCTNGTTFREEEIEEDDINSFEPKVLELVKQMNYNPCLRVSEESKAEGVGTNKSNPLVDPREQEDAGNMELEFEEGLIDTYSDLFAEMSPDTDFIADGLDLEEGEIVE
ncbi:box C/D snoRNA protein 1 isoform X2 [Arabidopsis lyrata subsp. lyrata]|uniref:box C/D snoRNA protein 1 isoform X2 n=1 Tax=Arabidopsis lyrata subsp. lyrata TaxID=81972 RepID=UPI000A29CC15|nr:box C/D snoRNA protein 1 isoform X2 [Arabidopsis lyrata subsp. lyrata]|eukprot:XP_020870548.1 box C/D snoRNA protein 1 isoform X2 [Arabidopsis lyrata subsp. lyrata]